MHRGLHLRFTSSREVSSLFLPSPRYVCFVAVSGLLGKLFAIGGQYGCLGLFQGVLVRFGCVRVSVALLHLLRVINPALG